MLALTSCGDDAPTVDEAPPSGIVGVVTAGPMCPVVVAGSPCPDAPWQGTVRITTVDDELVREVDTDDRGRFRVHLAPGAYRVVAVTSPQHPPSSPPRRVTVADGRWTEVSLVVDTGIR